MKSLPHLGASGRIVSVCPDLAPGFGELVMHDDGTDPSPELDCAYGGLECADTCLPFHYCPFVDRHGGIGADEGGVHTRERGAVGE